MAESSACLMRSFSQPSSTSLDAQQGDPLRHALTASVSFGRFVSESLSWEKWSSFTHNRYLEEVEKYAKPGSVAEKKAYFEARYKRKAAQKAAAASLEQQSGAFTDIPESNLENVIDNNSSLIEGTAQGQDNENPSSDLSLPIDEFSTDECAQRPKGYYKEIDQFEGLDRGVESSLEGGRAKEEQIDVINSGVEQPDVVENQDELYVLPEHCKSPQITCSVENDETEQTKQDGEHHTLVQKQVEASTMIKDAQCVIEQQEMKSPAPVAATTQVSAFLDKKKPTSTSAKLSGCKPQSRLRPPSKTTTPIQPKNCDQASSYHKWTGKESAEKKKSTLKSLHMSINLGSRVGDTDKLSSAGLQKIANSRPSRNLNWTTGENLKQKTPTRASSSGVSKHLSATSCPVIGGTRKSLSESVTGDRKSETQYMRGLLSSTKSRPKAQQPIVSASFNLRTEERAAKRKEKLQQKLSMEAAEKEHLQARVVKEKIQIDAKNVWRSVASQGKANTRVHLGTETLDVRMKKITRTQASTPGIRRKLDSDIINKPIWRHSMKADCFKDLLGKNHHLPPTHSTKLFPRQKCCLNENTSPNIQE